MSSVNLIEKAKELKSLLETVIKDNPQLPANPQKYIAETVTHASALVEQLDHISNNWVKLTNLESQEKAMLGNVQFWDAIPPGFINGDAVVDLVLNHSTTLKTLYQGAIDIVKLFKFSEMELKTASEIGDKFTEYKDGWSSFKRALAPGGNGVSRAECALSIQKFLNLLSRSRVITGYRLHFLKYNKKGGEDWVEAKAEFMDRKLPPKHHIMFEFDGFNSSLASFFTGNWFNAYAYTVFSDQLKRLESDYEIYSMVHFHNRASAGRNTKGDFDLIVNIGSRLLLVECKSGRILGIGQRDDFADIRAKTETLKGAFRSTRINDYSFLLLFNPDATDQNAVRSHFDPLGIKAVTPADIRGVVIDLITNHS